MRRAAVALAALAALAPGAAPASAAARPALVEQMVVSRAGDASLARVRASETVARVGRRRCAVPAGTALAALVRSRPPRLGLRDFGSCSRRARDAAGLFVSRIGRDRNRGRDGWVYKVGQRQATAGAADPAGPFGRGRLRGRARVTWFYCRLDAATGSCQPTLAIRARVEGSDALVRVLAHDDEGRSRPAAGATVRSGPHAATADATGLARLPLPAGRHALHAEQPDAIRSFPATVTVP